MPGQLSGQLSAFLNLRRHLKQRLRVSTLGLTSQSDLPLDDSVLAKAPLKQLDYSACGNPSPVSALNTRPVPRSVKYTNAPVVVIKTSGSLRTI